MSEHGGPDRLKEDLLTLADPPSTQTDPLPAIRRRIARRRRRRATVAVAGFAAGATVAVAAGLPVLSSMLDDSANSPATSPRAEVTTAPEPATERDWGGFGEWRDEEAVGPAFAEYGTGPQGTAYLVRDGDLDAPSARRSSDGRGAGAELVVVSHWRDGTGDPCLALVADGADERFCFEGWPEGERVTWATLGGDDGVVVGFVRPEVGQVGIEARAAGNMTSVTDSAPVVGTPTSADLSYFVEPVGGELVDVQPYRETPPDFTLPEPWSDREFTEQPLANAFRPVGYYVAEGELDGRPWGVISDRGVGTPCLTVEPQGVFDAAVCFEEPAEGAMTDWHTQTAVRGSKPDLTELDSTLVVGVAPIGARSVEIETADGQTYPADAVGTPSSESVRFFATVVPQRDAEIVEVRSLDADGKVVEEAR